VPHELDLAALRLLRARGHDPRAERLVRLYSRAGEHGVLWHLVAALGLLPDLRRRDDYLHAIRAVLVAYALNTAIKYVVRRPRPDVGALTSTVSDLSFPSAHAAMSFAFARSLRSAPLYAAASAMSLSRPYLGVHYPSDIAAGAALGVAVAELAP
jgi:membrane-associated phospholipid phosphatase